MNTNDVKKELYKSKVDAKLAMVVSGTMYYTVQLESGLYQFPIEQLDPIGNVFKLEAKTQTSPIVGMTYHRVEEKCFTLSTDLGTTAFMNVMKASELIRWISKAIDKGEFIEVVGREF